MMQWGDPRLPPSFWKRCIPEPNSGCWLMLGRQVPGGYTQFYDARIDRLVVSHRYAYEIAVGALPAYDPSRIVTDLELDHRCRTPCCANPDHLDLVTHAVNYERGVTNACITKARQTTCAKGHPFSIEVVKGRAYRRCIPCRDERLRRRYAPPA